MISSQTWIDSDVSWILDNFSILIVSLLLFLFLFYILKAEEELNEAIL